MPERQHEVSAFFDNEPEPGSPKGDRFEILLALVEAYERKRFPVDLPEGDFTIAPADFLSCWDR